jgi:hypothetical protein
MGVSTSLDTNGHMGSIRTEMGRSMQNEKLGITET